MISELAVAAWVEGAPNAEQSEFREAVHTILSGIANDPELKATMVIKGGILLAIRYQSHRYTKDIDFSTDKKLSEIDTDWLTARFNKSMAQMAESFDYDLDCRVQSCRVQPAHLPDAEFPAIKMKIGYAYKGQTKHRRLMAGHCPTTIDIDFSLNELMPNIEEFVVGEGEVLSAYALTDLFAEKLRSVLQQKTRGRTRRQDIYDLFLLLEKIPTLDVVEKEKVLRSLLDKARSRNVEPTPDSLRDKEIAERSRAEYHTLADEIDGDLPDFDEIYSIVQDFYESLPW